MSPSSESARGTRGRWKASLPAVNRLSEAAGVFRNRSALPHGRPEWSMEPRDARVADESPAKPAGRLQWPDFPPKRMAVKSSPATQQPAAQFSRERPPDFNIRVPVHFS